MVPLRVVEQLLELEVGQLLAFGLSPCDESLGNGQGSVRRRSLPADPRLQHHSSLLLPVCPDIRGTYLASASDQMLTVVRLIVR